MPNLTQISTVLLMTMMGLSIPISHAQTLLPAQQAFQFSVESANEQQARLSWQIQPNYYLYQHRFTVNSSKGAIKFNLPKGKAQFDENFGESIVYWNQVEFSIKTQPNQTYSVSWQGCAKDQICYAPQKKEFRTDATGRVIQDAPTLKFATAQPSQAKSVFLQGKSSNNTALESERPAKLIDEPVTTSEKVEKKTELAKENALNEKSAKDKAEPQQSEKNVTETAKPSVEPKALATEKKAEMLATAKQAQQTATAKTTEPAKATDSTENKTLTAKATDSTASKTAPTEKQEKAVQPTITAVQAEQEQAKAEKNVKTSATAVTTTTTSSPSTTKAENEHQDTTAQAVAKDMAQIATTTALAEQTQQLVTSTAPVQPAESKQTPSLSITENQTSEQNTSSSTESPVLAKDQQWLQQLQQHSFWYAVALFLGLGFLLAFTPCSLPMIPIVSSLLLRQTQGVKAWSIALVFVLSMATVYAVMGFIASSAGLGLQRWLQQPMVLVGFSVLFIVFALNLFGAFELQLPNRLVRRLDQWQSLQSGGTFVSAGVMGVLSALLVGPCMTAPLAGILLFIAQSEQQWQGAVLLFSLGFGMGIPLLLVSVLGARVLPRAGEWMNQVKAVFAFMMLGLSIYFVRPLLPEVVYAFLWYALAIAVVAYALFRFMWQHRVLKVLYSVMCVGALFGVASCHYQQYKHMTTTSSTVATWQGVQTVAEFKQALSNAPANRPIIIDVYADWCVACQPIEKMLKTSDVQQALKGYTLIKLDLSQFDEQHQAVLDEWQVLGPPTMLFLDAQQQEQRHLRLTGAFTQDELFKRLQP